MAVLARTLGIPSRVSVGYVAGEWDTDKEVYTVREVRQVTPPRTPAVSSV